MSFMNPKQVKKDAVKKKTPTNLILNFNKK